jgi:hypothetical protein
MIPILNTIARRWLVVGGRAAENRLNVIANRVKDECSVVVWSAKTGHSVFHTAGRERGCVEGIDFGCGFSCEGGVLFHRMWGESIDPEDGIFETVPDAIDPRTVGYLHRAAHSERA